MWSMNQLALTALLDAGANIDVQDKDGWTLLMVVCVRELAWCDDLLRRGANPHLRNKEGRTAWDYLGMYNINPALYTLFLKRGVDVNQVDPEGRTALHRACEWNLHTVIVFLLTQGADPQIAIASGPQKGQTAYDWGKFWSTPDGIRARQNVEMLTI